MRSDSSFPLIIICGTILGACTLFAICVTESARYKAESQKNFAPTNIVIIHDHAENGSPSPGGEGRGEGGITPSPTLNSNNSQPSTK